MSKQDAHEARSSYRSSETPEGLVNTGVAFTATGDSNMSTSPNLTVNWTNVPTRTITAGGVELA
jgi:hypothetical protein